MNHSSLLKHLSCYLSSWLLLASPVIAGDGFASKDLKFWAEWDLNCYESSVKIRGKENLKTLDSNYCATFSRRSGEDSTREMHFLMSDRHVEALVASAFKAKRKDVRMRALEMLSFYPCRTRFGCEQLKLKLESAIKTHANLWTKSYPQLLSSAQTIVERLKKELLGFTDEKIEKSGVCNNTATASKWVSELFTMHCPLAKFNIEPAVNIVDEKAFAFDLEMHSGQLLRSDVRLMKIAHSGLGDCHKGWTTNLVCGDSTPKINLTFDCRLVDSGQKSWGQQLLKAECQLRP